MLIYLAADHRGFYLKEKLKSWLKNEGYQIKDFGNLIFDPQDDYPDFSYNLARELKQNPNCRGIVLCGSGIGVSIVVNRFPKVRCALGFNQKQVAHGRVFDDINCLSLPADFINFNQAKKMINSFLTVEFKSEKKYQKRLDKIDQIA